MVTNFEKIAWHKILRKACDTMAKFWEKITENCKQNLRVQKYLSEEIAWHKFWENHVIPNSEKIMCDQNQNYGKL